MSGDIDALNIFLNSLGIQGISNKDVVTSADFTGTGTGTQTRKLTIGTSYKIISQLSDFNPIVSKLTSLHNLKELHINQCDITKSPSNVIPFNKANLSILETNASKGLTSISIYDQHLCISDKSVMNLTNLKLDYANAVGALSTSLGTSQFCLHALNSDILGNPQNTNGICSSIATKKYNNLTLPTTSCADPTICSGGGGTLCIKSVEIKESKLVITTESCGSNPPSTSDTSGDTSDDTSGDTSSTESQGTGVSYSSCTSCGNNKTLLRNKVDEVKDDSSLLYNRDSNNEVCNHCLVSIGDEKHCNRFLEKEECNYLGDSYNWVGA